jgi:hypothetical protein
MAEVERGDLLLIDEAFDSVISKCKYVSLLLTLL